MTKYVTRTTNVEFRAIQSRRSNPSTVMLRMILKSGKPGAAREYRLYGCEKTTEDVIARLEQNNPGSHWIEA